MYDSGFASDQGTMVKDAATLYDLPLRCGLNIRIIAS